MDLLTNKEAEEILKSADKEKAQSFLLEGTDGIGKKELAMQFAYNLLGNESRVKQGSHPDFLLIERKIDQKTGKQKAEIVVDDARNISSFLSLTPAEGDHRVCIVNPADALNNAAANSILKILEEPPKRSIIILLSHGGYLLPTIRSRCVAIKLKSASFADAAAAVKAAIPQADSSDCELLTMISGNSAGLAMKIYENEGLDVSRETFKIFSSFPSNHHSAIANLASNIAKNPAQWEAFKVILTWLTVSIAKYSAKIDKLELEGFDLNSSLSNFQNFLDAEKLANQDIRNADIYNLDKKQVITDIFQRFSACYG